jgi:hypothetical protein
MITIKSNEWPRIDRAINAARASVAFAAPVGFAVARDVQSRRLVVTAVSFEGGRTVRARIARDEVWMGMK